MSEQRFSRILSTIRDNGDLATHGQFALTKEEADMIEAFGVENFRRLLHARIAEQLRANGTPKIHSPSLPGAFSKQGEK